MSTDDFGCDPLLKFNYSKEIVPGFRFRFRNKCMYTVNAIHNTISQTFQYFYIYKILNYNNSFDKYIIIERK